MWSVYKNGRLLLLWAEGSQAGRCNTQSPLQGGTCCPPCCWPPRAVGGQPAPSKPPGMLQLQLELSSGPWVLSGPTPHLSFALCFLPLSLSFPPSHGSGSWRCSLINTPYAKFLWGGCPKTLLALFPPQSLIKAVSGAQAHLLNADGASEGWELQPSLNTHFLI